MNKTYFKIICHIFNKENSMIKIYSIICKNSMIKTIQKIFRSLVLIRKQAF